ncbi:trypsin-like protease, partial [Metarhizium majus ARSEF 297]
MAPKAAFTLAVAFSALLASAATIDKRIVNGVDVKKSEIKFIVSMRTENGIHGCGGSLLDGYTVLTAAHCIVPQLVSVAAGPVKNAGVEAKIASAKIRPDFISDFPNGISDTIDYAPLPPANWEAVVNSTAVAAGWGSQKPMSVGPKPGEKNSPAETLSKVFLGIHAREDYAKYQGVGETEIPYSVPGDKAKTTVAQSRIRSIQANEEYCNLAGSCAVYQMLNLKKLEALRAQGKELCKELGKDLDQCRPQVAEDVFRASAQKNNGVDDGPSGQASSSV